MTNRELKDIIENIKEKEKLGLNDIASKCGLDRSYLSKLINLDNEKKVTAHLFGKISSKFSGYFPSPDTTKTTHKPARKPKTETNTEKEGIIFVPISAQAGYTQAFTDPVYLNQLERVYMPGFPYRGEKFRIFEVAGDSMEPTLKEGYYVVGEKVEHDYWNTIADFYIYVIITEDRCIVKRLVKKGTDFVAISDNEFHPQFILKSEEIKEIWNVKRKIDWEMPPPKRFEVTV